jgi:hypothetical protein
MGHGHAGDGGPADVIVRNEEGGRHRAEHADLVPYLHQVGLCGWLYLADQLKGRGRHDPGKVRTRAKCMEPQRMGPPSQSSSWPVHPVAERPDSLASRKP